MQQLEAGRIIANCIDCGNNVAVWDDDPKPLCEYCDHAETCLPPKTIVFYQAWFTGTATAECTTCSYLATGWECNCDLEHNCKKH